MDRDLVKYLMEIRETLGRVDEKLDQHLKECAERDKKVDSLEKKVLHAESTMKMVRWVVGAFLVTLPASLASIAKILKP